MGYGRHYDVSFVSYRSFGVSEEYRGSKSLQRSYLQIHGVADDVLEL
jgi:hypothetical protein